MLRSLGVLTFLMFSCGVANAGLFYQFTQSGSVVSSPLNVAPGSTVTLDVFLAEDGTGAASEQNQLTARGGLRTNASSITVADTGVASITSGAANTAQFPTVTSETQTASNYSVSEEIDPFFGTPVTANSDGQVLVGTITLTVTGSIGDATTISANDFSGASDLVAGDFTTLDGILSAPTTVTIAVVPEPGSMALCGIFGTALLAGAARRRRKKAAEKAAA